MIHKRKQYAFRTGIRCTVFFTAPCMGRSGKNNRPSAGFPHMIHRILAAEKRRPEIDIHYYVKSSLITGIQRRDRRHTGIVEESVDSSILCRSFIKEFFTVFHIGEFCMDKDAFRAISANRSERTKCCFFITTADYNLSTLGSELLCCRFSHTGCPSGNDNNFPFKSFLCHVKPPALPQHQNPRRACFHPVR